MRATLKGNDRWSARTMSRSIPRMRATLKAGCAAGRRPGFQFHPAHAGYVEGRPRARARNCTSRSIPRMRATLKGQRHGPDRADARRSIPRMRATLKVQRLLQRHRGRQFHPAHAGYVEGARARRTPRSSTCSIPRMRATLKEEALQDAAQAFEVPSRACGLR